MNNRKCLIVSGGECGKINIKKENYDLVIACDRGYENSKMLGINADVLIGDFDSMECPHDQGTPDPKPEIIRFPVRKDDTDTMLAARLAMERGFTDITLCCCLGGRLDHLIANIQTLAWIVSHGGYAEVIEENELMFAFADTSVHVKAIEGWSLSVFSLCDVSRHVTIRGTSYTLDDGSITNNFPVGLGNFWADKEAVISAGDGQLLVVCSRLKDI